MPLLIDGHNLIGQMTGLSLEDEHDEVELVLRLRSYHAHIGKPITVIFDHGLPGGVSRNLSRKGVRVIFASTSLDADRLLTRRIRKSQNPRALTVVTTDQEVAHVALRRGVRVVPSNEFARQLETFNIPISPATPSPDVDEDPQVSPEELDEWLALFGQKPDRREQK